MVLVLTKKQKPKEILIYFNAITGDIKSISPVAIPDLEDYLVKSYPWDEGIGLLTGEKSVSDYFVNVLSIKKELVKRRTNRITGTGLVTKFVDMLRFDQDDSVINIAEYNVTTNQLRLIMNLAGYEVFVTAKENPLLLYGATSETCTFDNMDADFSIYRKVKIDYSINAAEMNKLNYKYHFDYREIK